MPSRQELTPHLCDFIKSNYDIDFELSNGQITPNISDKELENILSDIKSRLKNNIHQLNEFTKLTGLSYDIKTDTFFNS